MQVQITPAQTAAIEAPNYAVLNLLNYPSALVSASALAGGEEVDIYLSSAGAWVPYAALTATVPFLVVPGGAQYGILKDATAASCAVSADVVTAF